MEFVSAPFRSYALVAREQIALNYRNIREAVGPGVEVAAVVKADAYGHGMLEVSRVLTAEGATWLAVSSVEEGALLRTANGWWSTASHRPYIRSNRSARPTPWRVSSARRSATT